MASRQSDERSEPESSPASGEQIYPGLRAQILNLDPASVEATGAALVRGR